MATEWFLLILVVVLIAANALFVAAEFAFVTVDRPTVANLADSGDRRAASLQAGLARLSTQLSGAQLGITVTSLVVGFIAEPSIAALLAGPLEATGLGRGAAAAIALTVAFLIATMAQMVFGELVPKNWAIAEPLRVGRAVAGAQRAFTWVTGPAISVLNGAANRLVRALGMEPQEELASARSARELGALAARSAEQGLLDEDVARRVTHSVALGERTAADAMTPRPRVRFLEATAVAGEVLALAARTGHARFPVLGESVDDVVGVVHFRDALGVPAERRDRTPVADLLHPVHAVPSAMPLDAVLDVLRRGFQLAVVVDEYGGTDGIVTLEDIVEEIVGEIQDEQDRPVRRLRPLPDGSWLISGLMRPDEVAEETGIELPEGRESDTVGGLVTEHLERFAQLEDVVELPARHRDRPDELSMPGPVTAVLRVVRLDGWRVDRVSLTVVHDGDGDGDGDGDDDDGPGREHDGPEGNGAPRAAAAGESMTGRSDRG